MYNAELKLQLLRILSHIGASQPLLELWNTMDIKSIQWDSLSHYSLPFLIQSGHIEEAVEQCVKIRHFYMTSDVEILEGMLEPFKHGSFKKAQEFAEFWRRLTWSLPRAIADTEILYLSTHSPLNCSKIGKDKYVQHVYSKIQGFLAQFSASCSFSVTKRTTEVIAPSAFPFNRNNLYFSFSQYHQLSPNFDDSACEPHALLPSSSSSSSSSSPSLPSTDWQNLFTFSPSQKTAGQPPSPFPNSADRSLSPASLISWIKIRRFCVGILMEMSRPLASEVGVTPGPSSSGGRGGGGGGRGRGGGGGGKGGKRGGGARGGKGGGRGGKGGPSGNKVQVKEVKEEEESVIIVRKRESFDWKELAFFVGELVGELGRVGVSLGVVGRVPSLLDFLSYKEEEEKEKKDEEIHRIWGLCLSLPFILIQICKFKGEQSIESLQMVQKVASYIVSETTFVSHYLIDIVKGHCESGSLVFSDIFPFLNVFVNHFCSWLTLFLLVWPDHLPNISAKPKKGEEQSRAAQKEARAALRSIPSIVPLLKEVGDFLEKTGQEIKSRGKAPISFPSSCQFFTIEEVGQMAISMQNEMYNSLSSTFENHHKSLKYWISLLG